MLLLRDSESERERESYLWIASPAIRITWEVLEMRLPLALTVMSPICRFAGIIHIHIRGEGSRAFGALKNHNNRVS
jgi:hypothetical protein